MSLAPQKHNYFYKNRLGTFWLFFIICANVRAGCPTGYIEVPKNEDNKVLAIKSPFCVMKYSARAQTIKNGSHKYKAVSVPKGIPWRNINFEDAKKACENLGKGYGLINNNEWMTIANNIVDTAQNWSGGKVGVGFLNRGHTDDSPSQACDALLENVEHDCSTKGKMYHQKRTHYLSNGEVIWDLAGNLWEWVDWEVKYTFSPAPSGAWIDYKYFNPKRDIGRDLDLALFRSTKYPQLMRMHGIGLFLNGPQPAGRSVAVRGGKWATKKDYAGVYSLALNVPSVLEVDTVTFRCVLRQERGL